MRKIEPNERIMLMAGVQDTVAVWFGTCIKESFHSRRALWDGLGFRDQEGVP